MKNLFGMFLGLVLFICLLSQSGQAAETTIQVTYDGVAIVCIQEKDANAYAVLRKWLRHNTKHALIPRAIILLRRNEAPPEFNCARGCWVIYYQFGIMPTDLPAEEMGR